MSATELRALCPFCGSLTQNGRIDGKFYINSETGLYFCHHCQISGKDLSERFLEELEVIDEIAKKEFKQSSLSKLKSDSPELKDFLDARLNGAADLPIAYSPEHKAIAIITTNFNQEVVGIKYRRTGSESPRYLSEPGSVNEGFWIKGDDDKLLIVEGEIDALTGAVAGFRGTILATQTNRLSLSASKHVKAFKNVFVIPDKDLGGEELKNSIAELLGPLKAVIISLPHDDIKDLNDLLTRRGYEECREFIRVQTRTELEKDTKTLSGVIGDMVSFLSDQRNLVGDSTGWLSVDSLLGGGLRPNEMSVINAFAKTGKTSFIQNLIHNLAKSGKKIALASFEADPATSIFPSLLSIAGQINIRSVEDANDLNDLVRGIHEESPYLDNIFILRRFGYTPWHEIEEWATEMKRAHGIEYLILDHAGFMTEKMTDAEENQVLAKNIKKLTNTLNLHIPVVVQAPKTKDGLSIQTSYGGLAWGMNADNFFILERSKDNENELRVKLEAARYPGANPGQSAALLYYTKETCSLNE